MTLPLTAFRHPWHPVPGRPRSTGYRHVNGSVHTRLACRAWRAAHSMGNWRGSRPQATAAESMAPSCRPLPASRAICRLAGQTANSTAVDAAEAQGLRRINPTAQVNSATPLP